MSARFPLKKMIELLGSFSDSAEIFVHGQTIRFAINEGLKISQSNRCLIISSIRQYILIGFRDLMFDEMTWQGGIECFLEVPLDERYDNAGAMLSWLIANDCRDEAAEILEMVQEKYPEQFQGLKAVLKDLGVSELPKSRCANFWE